MMEWWDLRSPGSPTLIRVEVVFLFYAAPQRGQVFVLRPAGFRRSIQIPTSGDETEPQCSGRGVPLVI